MLSKKPYPSWGCFMNRSFVEYFHSLVRGEEKGSKASACRFLLEGVSRGYSAVIRSRNYLYDQHFKRTTTFDIPVISVGNLTLGGTGKTPFVVWLATYFQENGYLPGILSRGYGASTHHSGSDKSLDSPYSSYLRRNDEAKELALLLPDVTHFQSPNRIKAAQALREYDSTVNLLLLDDGFQYRCMGRSLDIVLLDALDPFGMERLFPRGFLREPLHALSRADVILLSRADLISDVRRDEIFSRVHSLAPQAEWGAVAHRPTAYWGTDEKRVPFSQENGTNEQFYAFCGLGNPAGFRHTLERYGIVPLGFQTFPDHWYYSNHDIEELITAARNVKANALLTTMKDRVKISAEMLKKFPFVTIEIGMEFIEGEDTFRKRLVEVV